MKFDCKVCQVLQFYLPAVAKEIVCFNCERKFNITNNSFRRTSPIESSSRPSTPLPITNGNPHHESDGSQEHAQPYEFIPPKPPVDRVRNQLGEFTKAKQEVEKKEEPSMKRNSTIETNGTDHEEEEYHSNTSTEDVSKRGRKRKKTERLVQLEQHELEQSSQKRTKSESSPSVSFRNSPMIPTQPHPNNTCGGCAKRLNTIPNFKTTTTKCIDCIRWFCVQCTEDFLMKEEDSEYFVCKVKKRCNPTARGRARLKHSPDKAESKPKMISKKTISSEPTANGIKIRNWANRPVKRRPKKRNNFPALGTIICCDHEWCTYTLTITAANQRRAKTCLNLHTKRCLENFKNGRRLDYNPNGKSTYVAISKFGLGHQSAIKTEPLANIQGQYHQEQTSKLPEQVPLFGLKKEIMDETTNIEEIDEDDWSTDEEGGSSADEVQQSDSPPYMTELDMLPEPAPHPEVPVPVNGGIPVPTNGVLPEPDLVN